MTGVYNNWLVLLSYMVAVIASYVALNMASRVSSSSKNAAKFWLMGGSVAMGAGIWSMHFIGMLAFKLPIPMSYDVEITLLSLLIAIGASGFALFTINRDVLTIKRLLTSGVFMGLGIASMHYVGMAAMRMSPAIQYDTTLFILSIVIAIAASIAALWIAFNLRSDLTTNVALKRIGAALVMGIAIVGMHYVGMAAANFAPDSICFGDPYFSQIGNVWMAVSIAGCTVLFLLATMLISVFDAKITNAKLAKSVMAANDLLKEEINERRRAESALQQSNAELMEMKMAADAANQAKSDFLANVSHELRTPLTLILAPLDQLLAHLEQPTDWRKQIERVQRNALLLMNRVNDILDFSKAQAEKFDVHLETIDLCQWLSEMVSDAQPVAQNNGCTLECKVDASLDDVNIDRMHFEKIFLNFLSNALKFTSNGGSIRVEAYALGDEMFEVAVIDSGIGIAEDQLPALFSRFHQVDSSATRAYGGTGLGLALVRHLAELMGGSVGVESSLGKGSRFFVRLPRGLNNEDRSVGRDQVTSPIPDSDGGMTASPAIAQTKLRHARYQEGQIVGAAHGEGDDAKTDLASVAETSIPIALVVDDNPEMLAYVSELLASQCRVITAINGIDAWTKLQQQKVNVIISDVMMPELDGLGLTARIKASKDFSYIPVILVTARGGTDASVCGLESGADDYISKPFSSAELNARVRSALRMADIQAQLREKSWEAGMAVVATGILHNLGNILNGVTVSSGIIQEKLRQSKIPMLQKAASLMRDHIDDLPAFIADDNRGKVLPSYITELSAQLELELSVLIKEVETLRSCTEHVTGFINVQQNFALAPSQLREMVAVNTLMDQAYKLTINTFEMKGIKVQCEFNCVESVLVDRHKVLQVLLNLLSNARHALQSRDGERRVILRTYLGDGVACMEVADNGVGIDSKDLPLIFNQGFTTKKDGHGFGLHSSANWVREMGGTLRATSDGVGHGVTFRFELPLAVAVEEVDDVSDYAAAPIQQT